MWFLFLCLGWISSSLFSLFLSVQLLSHAAFSPFPTTIPQYPGNHHFPSHHPSPWPRIPFYRWKLSRRGTTASLLPHLPKFPLFLSLPLPQPLLSFPEHSVVISCPLWSIFSLSLLWHSLILSPPTLPPTPQYFCTLSSGLVFIPAGGRDMGVQLTLNPYPLSKGRKA